MKTQIKTQIKKKKTTLTFKILAGTIRFFFTKLNVEGWENLPENNTIIVANHCQMNGPLGGQFYMKDNCYIWCAGQMMNAKEVPEYAFTDFWSQKPKWTHPFFRLLSYLIVPIAVCLFNNARTIAVYRDARIMGTFKDTMKLLEKDANILIFPEEDVKHNNILYRFQENFIDVAKYYYKKTGISLTFVPMYVAPKLKKMYIGQGITFNAETAIAEERTRIATYLSDEITKIARELPVHTVVPYRNIPKKNYLTNKDVTEVPR